MDLLPWLLDWPPSKGAVAAFIVITAFSVGTLVLFDPVTDRIEREDVTVETVDLTVRLNDEVDFPDAPEGTVQSCLASGTPGDSVSVLGDVTVGVPADRDRGFGQPEFSVVVSLAHTAETTIQSFEGTGDRTVDVFWIFEDDETLSAGEEATIQIEILAEGESLAEANRTVTVEADSRTYDC